MEIRFVGRTPYGNLIEDEDKLIHDRVAKEFSLGNSIPIQFIYCVGDFTFDKFEMNVKVKVAVNP